MPETGPAVPHTHAEIAEFIRRPEFADRLGMLELALKTGTVSVEFAARVLNLPPHAVAGIVAEMLTERMPEAVIQIEAETGFYVLLAKSPAEVGELVAGILAAHEGARCSVLQPINNEDIH
jgi:hypothetical protein